MIRLTNVSKRFPGTEAPAVDRFDLHVEPGSVMVLLGESGCGKTTTLKMINRLIDPSAGTIQVDNQNIADVNPVELRRHIGYVFQGIGLFPHMTIGANVAIVPKLLRWSRSDIDKRVDELLELVSLPPEEYRDRLPAQLSGGQQQRVGVARALAGKPKIMLMDEPFGALDPITRDSLQDEYRKIHDRLELTTVMVTHDMTEALLLADRICVMKAGQIAQVGTPHELLSEPADDYVKAMMSTPKNQADRIEALVSDAEGKA